MIIVSNDFIYIYNLNQYFLNIYRVRFSLKNLLMLGLTNFLHETAPFKTFSLLIYNLMNFPLTFISL